MLLAHERVFFWGKEEVGYFTNAVIKEVFPHPGLPFVVGGGGREGKGLALHYSGKGER
jgi:hypothetical protein